MVSEEGRERSQGWKVGLRISKVLAGYLSKYNADLAQFMLILFIEIPLKVLGAHAEVVVASASFVLIEGLELHCTPIMASSGLHQVLRM